MGAQPTDFDIIKKVQSGDRQAFTYLVGSYKDFAFSLAFKMLHNREEAEELVQDCFVKAFQKIHSFKFQSKFSTWFYTIIYRQALNVLRKNQSFINVDETQLMHYEADLLNPMDALQHKESLDLLAKAMEDLPADDAALLTLFYLNEQSLSEIAIITQIDANHLKVKLFRARKKILEIINRKFIDLKR